MYLENPDGITWRVRKVFAAAGFKDGGKTTVMKRTAAKLNRSGETGNVAVVHRGDVRRRLEGWLASGIGAGFPTVSALPG